MKFFWSDREGKSAPPNCTFYARPFSDGKELAFKHQQILLPSPGSFKVVKRTLSPDRESWIAGIKKVLKSIERKELEKAVLARTCTFELETAPNPFAIAAALKEKAQGAFVFCMETESGAFLGATPERLFSRNHRQIWSEAIAGTRPRGKTPKEDQDLAKQLLKSEKDLSEFYPVKHYLERALSPLCVTPPSFSPISIHQTHNVQHLYTSCSGELREFITDKDILSNIHPTPALCGTPKQKALSLIQDIEPFERGLYGGAIGWSTKEASEWIVGIRSCLIKNKTATLFTGTGIVAGSDPEEEWEELNQKLKLYDTIFI